MSYSSFKIILIHVKNIIPIITATLILNYLNNSERSLVKEGANKRGNTSRLTQSFHFFMFEPIFSPVNALNQPI